MEFRIADTFTDSLARLTGDEQKAVKTTAFDRSKPLGALTAEIVSPGNQILLAAGNPDAEIEL